MTKDSYVRNCLLEPREGEKYLFLGRGEDDEIVARLDGYAVIPIERYLNLTGESLPLGHAEKSDGMATTVRLAEADNLVTPVAP